MNLRSFRSWIRKIYATKDQEVDCDLVLQAIAPYVDAEVAGDDPTKRFPAVSRHLKQCPMCQDLYLALREAARAEQQDEEPTLVTVRSAERPRTGD
jgi:predicted anti-sigma-YlaC factor YlaD